MGRNLLLTLVSVVVGLLLIEAVCRLFVTLPAPYVNAPDLVVQDERGFWILQPGFAGGMDNVVDFRNRTLTVGPDGGRSVPCRRQSGYRHRVFVIGDSQTFGQGLSDADTWPNLLQCRLNEQGASYEVHNLSVPGTNIDTYVQRLRQALPVVAPGDRVIVGVTWNDLHTYEPESSVRHAAESLAAETPSGEKSATLSARPVMPYRLLRKSTWRYDVYRSTGIFVPDFSGAKAFVESMVFASAAFRIAYPRIRELVYRYRPADAFFRKLPDGTFENNFRFLAIMRQAAVRAGADFAVVLLPNRLFFDRTYYETYSQGGAVFDERDYPGSVARSYCPRHGMRCVSMFPWLKTDERDAYTFAFDGHYNPAGARRVADGVYSELFAKAR